MTTQDYPDWSPPAEQMLQADYGVTQQIAALIATGSPAGAPGGVPLLHGSSTVINSANIVIPAAGTTGVPGTFTAPGYMIRVEAHGPAGMTVPYLMVQMRWLDNTDLIVLSGENWVMPVSDVASDSVVFGKGPCKGSHLDVVLYNFDPAQAITVTVQVIQTTQYIARDDWRGAASANFPDFQVSNPDILNLVLAFGTAVVINAGVAYIVRLPLYAGQVQMWLNPTGAVNLSITFMAADTVNGTLYTVAEYPSVTGDVGPGMFVLPRSSCLFKIFNHGSAAVTLDYAVTALEYAS